MFDRSADATIDGFGVDHDGHASIRDFFGAEIFDGYTAQQKLDLSAFLLSFDSGTAPAVGYTLTLTTDTIDDRRVLADWSTLRGQARIRNVDLIVRGTINGQVRALSYRPLSDDYVFDAAPTRSLSRAELQALVRRGDTLTVMGVAPSSAQAVPEAVTNTTHVGGSRGH